MKNARMDDFTESDNKAYEGMHYYLRKESNGRHIWWSGTVTHRYGIARFDMNIICLSDKKERRTLTIEFVHEGQIHRRKWKAWYGLKTITRLANEMIEEITG